MMLRTMTWINTGSRDMKRVKSRPSNTILSWIKRVDYFWMGFELFSSVMRLLKDESRSKTTIIMLTFFITMTTTTFLTSPTTTTATAAAVIIVMMVIMMINKC